MCDHDDQPVLSDFLEQVHDLHRGMGIQGTCGFIRQEDLRVVHQCPGNGHTLHLSAGHLCRFLVELILQTHFLQCGSRPLFPLIFRHICQRHGQSHILQYGLVHDEVVALEHKPDPVVPVRIPVLVSVVLCASSVDDEIAAVVVVQAADDVQQRGLSAARGTENRYEFIVPECHRKIPDRMNDFIPRIVVLDQVFQSEHDASCSVQYSGRRLQSRRDLPAG